MTNGWLQWLSPGIKLKRWIFLSVVTLLIAIIGLLLFFDVEAINCIRGVSNFTDNIFMNYLGTVDPIPPRRTLGVVITFFGAVFCTICITMLIRSIAYSLNPRVSSRIADHVLRQNRLALGPRVVVIGGGTGLSTLLRGMKQHTSNITAIVTVTDDGGSSGSLRQDLGILPPGDIRNCLVALADAEPAVSALFQYRFDNLPALKGHAFGNIFIAAMLGITGDFESAIRKTSDVLAIRGRVLPSTLQHIELQAEMEDGTIVEGETLIVESPLRIRRVFLSIQDAEPPAEALQAIRTADVIICGPGSVYTSVIPNLLVPKIAECVHNSKATRIYVCNVMTQPGETEGYSASDHVKAIEAHIGKRIFDYILVNREIPSAALLDKYRKSNQDLVQADLDRIRAMGYKVMTGNFVSESDVVRHDSNRLAEAIVKTIKRHS